MKLIAFAVLMITVVACNPSLKEKFDAIEKIVGNDNWRSTIPEDTVYWYFSRTGDYHFNVYLYQMKNGDSTGTTFTEIKTTPDNEVIWKGKGIEESFLLNAVYRNGVIWKSTQNENIHAWRKEDSSHITFSVNRIKALSLQKTLPLATFLARARFDYEHGTKYLDSPLVNPRTPVKVQ